MQLDPLGRLARLRIPAEDRDRLAADLNEILAYVDQLAELDLTDLDPMRHAGGVEPTSRNDTPDSSHIRDRLLKQAPAVDEGLFVVPPVID